MPKTTIGLFEDPGVVGEVVREIEALGFPRNEVRTLDEPSMFDVTGVMSFARLEFEVDSIRELTRIGATEAEAQAYVEGLRHGGVLVFATGSDRDVDAAADIMRRSGAVEIEEAVGAEPHLPSVTHASMVPIHEGSILAGRFSQPDNGACVFVW